MGMIICNGEMTVGMELGVEGKRGKEALFRLRERDADVHITTAIWGYYVYIIIRV
jgi:hypothetical protein